MRRTETTFYAAKQLKDLAKAVHNPFFVIVMPGSLHILKVFMQYAPDTVNFVLILNGVNQWEKTWLQSRYPGFRKITLNTTLSHGLVMDLLIDHFQKPFGMIDYDCFVFEPDYFVKAQVIEEKTILNAFFCLKNDEIDLEIPQTYLLFFNPPVISKIKKKYHVNSKLYKYSDLSRKVRKSLASLGIDSEHLPELSTNLFDTFRVVLLLSTIEGNKVKFINKFPTFSQPNTDIFHIGAVHSNNNIQHFSFFRGSYFWRRCLEKSGEPELIEHYQNRWGKLTSQELLGMNPLFASYKSTKTFIEFVEQLIDRNNQIHTEELF